MGKPIKLSEEELRAVREGESLEELKLTPGWSVLQEWLQKRAWHSWVDPRGLKKEDWEWAELNAFHSADIAKELLTEIDLSIARAKDIRKKERGEYDDKFREMFEKLIKKKD
jgi:hypothetical protein